LTKTGLHGIRDDSYRPHRQEFVIGFEGYPDQIVHADGIGPSTDERERLSER
jgi:hypothetical protein